MFLKISSFFYRIANLKTFLLALAIYMVFGAYVMPMAAKKMNETAGKEVQILDLQLTGYTPEKARNIIGEYGDEGRKLAVFVSAVDDGIYPFAYTFLYIIITAWIFKALSNYRRVYPHFHLFPFLIMLVDFCENACLVTMFKTYPHFSDSLAQIANVFTLAKWGLVWIQTALILGALIMLIVYRARKPQSAV